MKKVFMVKMTWQKRTLMVSLLLINCFLGGVMVGQDVSPDKTITSQKECLHYWGGVSQGNIGFSEDGLFSTHLFQYGETSFTKDPSGAKIGQKMSKIYQYDLRQGIFSLVREGMMPKSDFFITQKKSLSSIIVATVVQPLGKHCEKPKLRLLKVSVLGLSKKMPVLEGAMSIVRGNEKEFFIYDFDNLQVHEFDPDTLQKRKLFNPLKLGQIPIYMHTNSPEYMIFIEKSEQEKFNVITQVKVDGTVSRKLSLPEDETIIADGKNIGAVKVDSIKNTLTVQQISSWSGSQTQTAYKITLPKDIQVKGAVAQVNFAQEKLIVQGATNLVRQLWKRAYIYDLKKMSLLTTIDPPAGFYVADVAFHSDGEHILANLQGLGQDFEPRLYIYKITSGKSFSLKSRNKAKE